VSKYLKTKNGSLESAVLEAVSAAQQAAIEENNNLLKDYEKYMSQGDKKDHNAIDYLMSMPQYKRYNRDQMSKIIGDALRKGSISRKAPFKMHKEETELDEAKFSDKEIKMAFGVINDPRWKGGNMTKIVNTIEKIKKGLSKFPSVAKAIQATNEELTAKQKKIDLDKDGDIDGKDLAALRKKGAKKEEVDMMAKYTSAISLWAEASGCKKTKKEEEEPEVKGKTMTGKPLDKIEVDPKDEDK